jgi:hypothetical protein
VRRWLACQSVRWLVVIPWLELVFGQTLLWSGPGRSVVARPSRTCFPWINQGNSGQWPSWSRPRPGWAGAALVQEFPDRPPDCQRCSLAVEAAIARIVRMGPPNRWLPTDRALGHRRLPTPRQRDWSHSVLLCQRRSCVAVPGSAPRSCPFSVLCGRLPFA